MMKQLLTIFILVFGLSAANAATWYVATTGSDANSGTNLAAAKLTINGAIAVASNGDIIRVANGTYASAVAVNKRVTIVGESNHITSGTIITNTITLIATGGSSSSRIVLDNICARNSSVTGDNSASIVVRSSYVTIQNCSISNTGLTPFVATTAGAGAGVRFYSPTSAGVLSDIVIRNNSFAYQAAGIIVSENVSINHGTSDQLIIEGNDFNEHTSNVIYFIETTSNASADSGKVKNVVIRKNNLRNNRQTTSALGSSIPINLLKGSQDLLIENTGIYSIARVAGSLHQIQIRPHFQGSTSNANFKDIRLARDADNNGFAVGLYIQPQNTTATYGTASLFSSVSNITIDGLYARNYYTSLIADQFVEGPVTVKNSNNLRSTAEEASFIVQPGNVINATMFGCPVTATPHIFDNNYTGVSTSILGFKRALSVTSGSNIGTVVDPVCSRANNTTSSSLLGKIAFSGAFPLGTCTTETGTSYEFNANAPITATAEFQFYNSDADRTTSSYLVNAFESATVTNHQANSLNVTTSADAPVGSFTTLTNAIAASSAGNKIRGFEHGITYSTISVDKDLTFVISGSDRFDSPAKVTFEALTVNSGQTLTLKGDMWTTGTLTINGTLDLNGYALVVNGTIAYGGAGEIKGGTAGSSIFYNSSSNSNLKMTSGFASLDLLVMNGSGTLTLSNNVTVTKQVRTAAGTLALNGFTLTIEGSGINPTGGSIDASVASSAIALNTAYPVSLANIVGSNLVLTRSIAGDVIAPGSSVFASIDLLGGNYGLTSGSTLVLSESSNFSGIGTIYATGTSTLQVNYATTPGVTPNLFGFGTISFTGAASATLGAITAPAAGLTINFNGPGALGDITGNITTFTSVSGTGARSVGNVTGTVTTISNSSTGTLTFGNIVGNLSGVQANAGCGLITIGTITGTCGVIGSNSATNSGSITIGNISSNCGVINHNSSGNITVGNIGGTLNPFNLGTSRTGNTSVANGGTINSLFSLGGITIAGSGTVNIGAFTLSNAATNFTISTTTGGNGGAVTFGNITSGSATIIPSFTSSLGAGPLTVGTITGNCGTISSSVGSTSGSITVGNISGNCGAITHSSNGNLLVGNIGGTASVTNSSSNRTGNTTIGNVTGAFTVGNTAFSGTGNITYGNITTAAAYNITGNTGSGSISIGTVNATAGAFGFTRSVSTSGTVTIGNITAGNLGNIANNGSTVMSIGNVASGNCGTVTNTSTGTLTIGTISGNLTSVATNVASSGLITIGNVGGTCGSISSATSTHGSITMGTIGGTCGVITHSSSGNVTVGTIGGVLSNPALSSTNRTGNTSIAANSTIASIP
ncbi:MAG: beta strand repeat-containing protein, partial [Flexibacteraceae bacterium]